MIAYLEGLTISRRIMGFSVIAILAVMLMGLTTFPALRNVAAIHAQFVEHPHVTTNTIKRMKYTVGSMRRVERDTFMETDFEKKEENLASLMTYQDEFLDELNILRKSYYGDKLQISELEKLFREEVVHINHVLALLKAGKREDAWGQTRENAPGNPIGLLLNKLDEIDKEASATALQMNAEAQNEIGLTVRNAAFLLAGSVLVLLVAALAFTRSTSRPLFKLRDSIGDLTGGKLNEVVPFQSMKNEIGEIGRGIASLQDVYRKMEAQRWIKMQIAQITADLQQASTFEQSAQTLLSKISHLLNAGYGVIYILEEASNHLRFITGYGYSDVDQLNKQFAIGEGLVGQCAREKTSILLTDPPDDYVKISSGLGVSPPKILALFPITLAGRVLGVLELASFRQFSEQEYELLELIRPILALNIERKRIEETLEQERGRQQQILDTSPVSVVFSTKDKIQFANPLFVETFGAKAGETTPQIYVHQDERDALLERLKEEGIIRNHEIQMFDRHKEKRNMLITYLPIKYGGEDGILGWIMDITDRTKVEMKLRHINFLNDQALDLTHAGYLHVPIDGSGWYNSSERAAKIFGDPPREGWRYRLMEEWFANVEAGDKAASEKILADLNAAMDGRISEFSSTYAYKRPVDGHVVWINTLGRVVKDANGKPTDMYGMTMDITANKLAEDAIRQATKVAEDATKMKSDFLANMSHEIRTPMNAIIGMAHLALKTDPTPRQRDYIKKIQASGQHLLGIINDILDFSKIEAGKLEIEHTDFDMEKVFSYVANLMAEKTSAKGLELVFDLDKSVPNILRGDSLRLGQILINYANNAVKFTEKGEVVITAKVLEETEDDVLVRFGVRDTGIGLSDEHKAKLFQSFQQADTSTSRKFGGTGLGLAISKQLAHLMHGNVGVESVLGQGSTFWFTALLGKVVGKVQRLLPEPDLRGSRMLVVDDNDMARNVLENMLTDLTFLVDKVPGGEEAIGAIKNASASGKPYKVIYLDLRMPGMDGIETAKAIYSLPIQPVPYLVMVTAYGREEVIREINAAGVDNVLVKPVTASSLFDVTMSVLGGQRYKQRTSEREVSNLNRGLAVIKGAIILLVEDNEVNQEVAVGLLEDAGFVVDIANNGQEAVDAVVKRAYDIVLMDLQMPVMDGVNATIKIREDARFRNLPILAMTANVMQQDREKCEAAGMNGLVAKPIDPDEMFKALLKWIKPRYPRISNGENMIVGMPKIAGLNVELGLKRVRGKAPLYLKILRRYVSNQRLTPVQIRQALDAGDRVTAERIAHSARSVNGNIGAVGLQEMAAELEKMIREGAKREALESKLASFASGSETLIAAIIAGIPQEEAGTGAPKPEDILRTGQVVTKLEGLLAGDDSEANELFEDNTELLRFIFGEDAFEQIERAIQQFDYESALKLVKARAETLNILSH